MRIGAWGEMALRIKGERMREKEGLRTLHPLKQRILDRPTILPALAVTLSLLLAACGFTTDAVATVGSERITRGDLNATAGTSPQADRAAALNQLIYGRLIELEARAQRVTIDAGEVNARNATEITAAQGTDGFQQNLLAQGYPSAAAYQQTTRQQLLIQKMRPFWNKPEVEAVTLQLLSTETQAKALEASQKGRAGTPFDDLLRAYSPVAAQDPQVVNSQGSIAVDALNPTIRESFKGITEGSYSDPIPTSGTQYAVLRIAKVERRAPTEREQNNLIAFWLDGLKTKYPVVINDPVLRATAR